MDLFDFLDNTFVPAAEKIVRGCKEFWSPQIYDRVIPEKDRTLSPSDFGFHNALRNPDGTITFLDFEYFGWDDPAKLVGDVLFHPAIDLSDGLKREWLKGTQEVYGVEMISRLRIMWPLLGLCWCIILLNEFRSDLWLRRVEAIGAGNINRSEILDCQLKRSQRLLSELQYNHQAFAFE